jgi:hypothetical protein
MRASTQTDLLSAFKALLAIMAIWCAASDHVQAQTPSDDNVSLIVEGTKFCQAFLNGAQAWNVEDFGFTSMSSPTADSDGMAVSPEANVIITASAGQEPNCVVLLRSKTENAKQVAQAMVDRLMNEGAYRLTTGPSQGTTQVFWALLSNASAPSGGHIIAFVDAFLDPTAQANPSLSINFSLAS